MVPVPLTDVQQMSFVAVCALVYTALFILYGLILVYTIAYEFKKRKKDDCDLSFEQDSKRHDTDICTDSQPIDFHPTIHNHPVCNIPCLKTKNLFHEYFNENDLLEKMLHRDKILNNEKENKFKNYKENNRQELLNLTNIGRFIVHIVPLSRHVYPIYPDTTEGTEASACGSEDPKTKSTKSAEVKKSTLPAADCVYSTEEKQDHQIDKDKGHGQKEETSQTRDKITCEAKEDDNGKTDTTAISVEQSSIVADVKKKRSDLTCHSTPKLMSGCRKSKDDEHQWNIGHNIQHIGPSPFPLSDHVIPDNNKDALYETDLNQQHVVLNGKQSLHQVFTDPNDKRSKQSLHQVLTDPNDKRTKQSLHQVLTDPNDKRNKQSLHQVLTDLNEKRSKQSLHQVRTDPNDKRSKQSMHHDRNDHPTEPTLQEVVNDHSDHSSEPTLQQVLTDSITDQPSEPLLQHLITEHTDQPPESSLTQVSTEHTDQPTEPSLTDTDNNNDQQTASSQQQVNTDRNDQPHDPLLLQLITEHTDQPNEPLLTYTDNNNDQQTASSQQQANTDRNDQPRDPLLLQVITELPDQPTQQTLQEVVNDGNDHSSEPTLQQVLTDSITDQPSEPLLQHLITEHTGQQTESSLQEFVTGSNDQPFEPSLQHVYTNCNDQPPESLLTQLSTEHTDQPTEPSLIYTDNNNDQQTASSQQQANTDRNDQPHDLLLLQVITEHTDQPNEPLLQHLITEHTDQPNESSLRDFVTDISDQPSEPPQTHQNIVTYDFHPLSVRSQSDRDERLPQEYIRRIRLSSTNNPFVESVNVHDAPRQEDGSWYETMDGSAQDDLLSGGFITLHEENRQELRNNSYIRNGMLPDSMRDANNFIPLNEHPRLNATTLIPLQDQRMFQQDRMPFRLQQDNIDEWEHGRVLPPRNGGFSEGTQRRPVISVRNSREYVNNAESPVFRLPQSEIDNETVCLVCRNRRAVAQLLPCGHVVYCDVCVTSQPSCRACDALVEDFTI